MRTTSNVGLYIFSQALTEKEAKQEAEYVLDLADKYGWDVTLPIVIDREKGSHNRLTGGETLQSKRDSGMSGICRYDYKSRVSGSSLCFLWLDQAIYRYGFTGKLWHLDCAL